MELRTIEKIDLEKKRIILRSDFNVPLIKKRGKWQVSDDSRIRACLETIRYLLKKNCKIVLLSYLARPNGRVNEDLRLEPVARRLAFFLNRKLRIANRRSQIADRKSLIYCQDCFGQKVERIISQMEPRDIVLLENTRFYPEEDKNDLSFARKLAKYGEIFINNAFSQSHRKCASIVGISKYLPTYPGFLMEKEIEVLSRVTEKPARPLVLIIGGAKAEDKIPVIRSFLKKADKILVGGKIANLLLMNKSKPFFQLKNKKIQLPIDGIASRESQIANRESQIASRESQIWDIGPETIGLYKKIIKGAKTIVWVGPMGVFEDRRFSRGTREIAKAVLKSKARVLIGGGDTEASLSLLKSKKIKSKNFYISTAGGAMLKFLAGEKLPGIKIKN